MDFQISNFGFRVFYCSNLAMYRFFSGFWMHYKRKGCFKYSPKDKILSNDLFRRFSVRNTCLFSKILLERHIFLTNNLLKRSL